jgi:bisphosphoglycerate-dependent phosphoglycerate mutase
MYIEQLTREEVLQLEIPTGIPWQFDYQHGQLKRIN